VRASFALQKKCHLLTLSASLRELLGEKSPFHQVYLESESITSQFLNGAEDRRQAEVAEGPRERAMADGAAAKPSSREMAKYGLRRDTISSTLTSRY